MTDERDLVELWRAWGETELALVRGLLEANGIESAIRGESTRITHAFTLDGLAEVRIFVREEDLPRASELLSEVEGMTACASCGRPAREADPTCPHCGKPLPAREKGDPE